MPGRRRCEQWCDVARSGDASACRAWQPGACPHFSACRRDIAARSRFARLWFYTLSELIRCLRAITIVPRGLSSYAAADLRRQSPLDIVNAMFDVCRHLMRMRGVFACYSSARCVSFAPFTIALLLIAAFALPYAPCRRFLLDDDSFDDIYAVCCFPHFYIKICFSYDDAPRLILCRTEP